MSTYYYSVLRKLQDEVADEFDSHDEEHHDDDKPWGDVIAASLIIQAVTFVGLLLTIGVGYYSRVRGRDKDALMYTLSFKIIPAFACGALLATSVFLVIPESLVLLGGGHGEEHEEEEHHSEDEAANNSTRFLFRLLEEDGEHEEHEEDNESEASWKFGAALLSGFLFPILLHVFFPAKDEVLEEHDHDELDQDDDAEKTSTESDTAKEVVPVKEINWSLATSILVGDFFHNFTDGIFIGTSFLLCSRDVGYTIVATTVYHELAQEIADFALLHHHCGIVVWKALMYNFISGFSVMIGALLILSFDMSETAQGTTLAIAAGIYIYIAACECVPRIQAVRKGPKDTLMFLIFFILGAVPIGLVLLNHSHCDGHDEDSHDEHGEEETGDEAVRWLF
jgi:zinc transporter ZupT